MSDTLQGQVQEINAKINTIIALLRGNELDEESGMIHTVKHMQKEHEKLEERVVKLEKWKDRFFWMMIGMAMPAGYGISELIGMLAK